MKVSHSPRVGRVVACRAASAYAGSAYSADPAGALAALEEENKLLKTTISDAKAAIMELETQLKASGIPLPAPENSPDLMPTQPEDFWSPAMEVWWAACELVALHGGWVTGGCCRHTSWGCRTHEPYAHTCTESLLNPAQGQLRPYLHPMLSSSTLHDLAPCMIATGAVQLRVQGPLRRHQPNPRARRHRVLLLGRHAVGLRGAL